VVRLIRREINQTSFANPHASDVFSIHPVSHPYCSLPEGETNAPKFVSRTASFGRLTGSLAQSDCEADDPEVYSRYYFAGCRFRGMLAAVTKTKAENNWNQFVLLAARAQD
jgi:hypothetical protein